MKKGFTLVELMAIIVLLSVILLVSVPSIISSNKAAREENYKKFVETIEDAAETYLELHPEEFKELKSALYATNEITVTAEIKVSDLIKDGLISGTTLNPKTDKKISSENSKVIVKNEDNELKYTYESWGKLWKK